MSEKEFPCNSCITYAVCRQKKEIFCDPLFNFLESTLQNIYHHSITNRVWLEKRKDLKIEFRNMHFPHLKKLHKLNGDCYYFDMIPHINKLVEKNTWTI